MAQNKSIKFDVMMGDRFICTLAMPLGLKYLVGYNGNSPVFDIPYKAFKDYVEEKRPSLIGKKFHCELVTKQTRDLWRY